MIIDARKKCIDCKPKRGGHWPVIKGFAHGKYRQNTIIIPEYWCERHWQNKGRPAPEKLDYK